MDVRSEFLVLGGVQGASEHARFPIPVPNVPDLRGLALAFQALSGPLAQLEVTDPVVPVVH